MKPVMLSAVKPVLICAVAGIFVSRADLYFGTGDGMLGLAVLAFLLAAGLAFDFVSSAQELIHPRRLDFAFVAGADYPGRKRVAISRTRSACLRQTVIPAGTAAGVLFLRGHGPLFTLGAVGLLLLESLLLSAAFALVVRLGALPISRERFPGVGRPSRLGLSRPSLVLRQTFVLSGLLSSPVSGTGRWVLRRTLLHITRRDPVFLVLYLIFMAVLAVTFHLYWGLAVSGAFALAGCMLSLTLVRLATEEADQCYRLGAYLMPPPRIKFRCDLLLYLSLACVFSLYFAALSIAHMGMGAALQSAGFWQVLVTGLLFPFLIMVDAKAERRSTDTTVILNFGYLGISASLFLFPIVGLSIALALFAIAAGRCLVLASA